MVGQEEAQGLNISAVLKQEKPFMKAQSGFCRTDAVTVCVKLPAAALLAVYQHKEWWQRPAFLQSVSQVPENTQMLLWQADGLHHVLVALTGDIFRADMRGGEDGLKITLGAYQQGRMALECFAAVYAKHSDPYIACENAMALGLKLSGSTGKLRRDKRYPPCFDSLGFCSWDAFYRDVDEAGLIQKAGEFKDKGLPVNWMLIDDGWSKVNEAKETLTGLDAREDRFPGGLQSAVSQLKALGIERVGVWHALMGYWNGVEPGSEAAYALDDGLTTLWDGRVVPRVDNAFKAYSRWHGYLSRQGIDFVKVDEQSAPAIFYKDVYAVGQSARGIQDGLGASIGLHFSGNAIHCMGMAPQELWGRSSAPLVRASDDFVPQLPDGFMEHCIQNAYNGLLYGPLYWGDYDMFWSNHDCAQKHSMLRAVSGGPVYVSDKVGDTMPQTLWPLIDQTGRLLRCDGVGLPTQDCLYADPLKTGQVLKIFNHWQDAFLVASFNPSEKQSADAMLSLSDLSGANAKGYVAYDYQTQSARVISKAEPYHYTLPAGGAAICLLLPLKSYVTPIGNAEKYLAAAMIASVFEEKERMYIALKQAGVFTFFTECKDIRAWVCSVGEMPIRKNGACCALDLTGMGKTHVILEWKESPSCINLN